MTTTLTRTPLVLSMLAAGVIGGAAAGFATGHAAHAGPPVAAPAPELGPVTAHDGDGVLRLRLTLSPLHNRKPNAESVGPVKQPPGLLTDSYVADPLPAHPRTAADRPSWIGRQAEAP